MYRRRRLMVFVLIFLIPIAVFAWLPSTQAELHPEPTVLQFDFSELAKTVESSWSPPVADVLDLDVTTLPNGEQVIVMYVEFAESSTREANDAFNLAVREAVGIILSQHPKAELFNLTVVISGPTVSAVVSEWVYNSGILYEIGVSEGYINSRRVNGVQVGQEHLRYRNAPVSIEGGK